MAANTHRSRRFGQRPPPVSRLIKTILDRYPDGQIFKVRLNVNFCCILIKQVTFVATLHRN